MLQSSCCAVGNKEPALLYPNGEGSVPGHSSTRKEERFLHSYRSSARTECSAKPGMRNLETGAAFPAGSLCMESHSPVPCPALAPRAVVWDGQCDPAAAHPHLCARDQCTEKQTQRGRAESQGQHSCLLPLMCVYFQRTWIELKNLDTGENAFNCSGSALCWYSRHWQRFALPLRLPSRLSAPPAPLCRGILLCFPVPVPARLGLLMVVGAFLGNTRLSLSALVALAPLPPPCKCSCVRPSAGAALPSPALVRASKALKHSQPINEDLCPWPG